MSAVLHCSEFVMKCCDTFLFYFLFGFINDGGAFGSSNPSGFFSDDSELISEKNPLRSLRALFPNASRVSVIIIGGIVLTITQSADKSSSNVTACHTVYTVVVYSGLVVTCRVESS
jgi:hypothetical protein